MQNSAILPDFEIAQEEGTEFIASEPNFIIKDDMLSTALPTFEVRFQFHNIIASLALLSFSLNR